MEKQANPKFDVNKEEELILAAQAGDKMAFKRLRLMYQGVINDSIKRSKVSSGNIPEGALQAEALSAFRKSVMNYSPGVAKPSTYITNSISNSLKNVGVSYENETRIQSSDAWALKKMQSAIKQMEGEGIYNPSPEEIQEQLKAHYETDVDIDYIKKTMAKQRKELSGNTSIGEDGVGENITFEEMSDVTEDTTKDHLNQANKAEKLDGLLGKLDDNERDIYEELLGVGKFKGQTPMKMGEWARKHGFKTEHFGEKEVKRIENKLRGEIE